MIRVMLIVAAMALGAEARAQERFEAGIQITGVHLHKLHETPYGVGGRFLYSLDSNNGLEAEVVHYPEDSFSGMLIGTKNGRRWRRFGVFGKARLGAMLIRGDFYRQRLDRTTFLMADLGGVVEYYPMHRWVLRIDAGDTMLFYGSHVLFRGPNSPPLGTVHNFQPAFGLAFRL